MRSQAWRGSTADLTTDCQRRCANARMPQHRSGLMTISTVRKENQRGKITPSVLPLGIASFQGLEKYEFNPKVGVTGAKTAN